MNAFDEAVDFSDIPLMTNRTGWKKVPFAGQFKVKYTVTVEHEGYDEVREYDFNKKPYEMTVIETISKPLAREAVAV